MPTTIEEFKEALIQFQEQDVNGNGAADERAFIGLGMNSVFSDGVAQWFGLPRGNFAMSAVDGSLENAVEGEGYIDFVEYCAELYSANVALLNEGGRWNYGANTAGNYCAAQCIYPDSLLTVSTGDPDCDYEPLPIIQAVEGIAPRMMGQSVTTANSGMAFSTTCDYEAAAAYLDWLNGETFFILLTYGMEGKTWDYTEDGTSIVKYKVGEDLTTEEEESYGDMWHYAPWAAFPQIQAGFAWDFVQEEYSSVQEALDNGEPYTRSLITIDEWKEQYAVIAPMDGIVSLQGYWSKGQHVTVGSALASIVPEKETEVIGRMEVPSAGFGKVETGQTVNVKLNGFPYMEYGVLKGTIRSISSVPASVQTATGTTIAYTVEVVFPEGMRTTYEKELPMIQQMDGTGEIITEDMRLIEQFIQPVVSLFKNR